MLKAHCIHVASQRYCGSDQMVSFAGNVVWGLPLMLSLLDVDQIYLFAPEDSVLDNVKSLGYLLRGGE